MMPPNVIRRVANMLNNIGRRLAKERGCTVPELGVEPGSVAGLAYLVEAGVLNTHQADDIFRALADRSRQA